METSRYVAVCGVRCVVDTRTCSPFWVEFFQWAHVKAVPFGSPRPDPYSKAGQPEVR